jgi:FkbM family methyltransferase
MKTVNPKKILLITSSFEAVSIGTVTRDNRQGMQTEDDYSHYPLGLAYLHAYLEAQGHTVETLFLNNCTFDACSDRFHETLAAFEPDLIGFQLLTSNRVSTFRLIEDVHVNRPRIKIAIGGMHATLMYDLILKKYPYLYAVIGEGEYTFAELISDLFSENPDASNVAGLAFNRDGEIILTERRPLIEDLDALPFAKHEIFFRGKRTCGDILTARGCPFSCSFCCLDKITMRRNRKRSIANVIAEIEYMIGRFPQMTDIWIHDDTFFVDTRRVIEFCDEVIKRGIRLNFICSGRFKPLTEEMVLKLEQANFKRVLFGMESGSEEILKKCHKGINQADMTAAFKMFAKTNITVFCHLIVGLPGETEKTILETADFIKRMQKIEYINYTQAPYLLSVYPGTEVYEIAKQGGMINDNFWMTDSPVPIYTLENSAEKLLEFQELLMDNINPVRAFSTWRGFKAQFFLIPRHLKYILSDRNHLKVFLFYLLRLILPERAFNLIRKMKKVTLKAVAEPGLFLRMVGVKLNSLFPWFGIGLRKTSYSQSGEDLIIDYLFKILKIKKPSYLDIGAFQPVKLSNTYLFYRQGGRGVCVEPDPILCDKFQKKRDRDVCLNIGIGLDARDKADFFVMSSQTLNTFSRVDALKLEETSTQKIKQVYQIDLKPVDWVTGRYFNDEPLDLVSIDTEGMELDILKSWNFDRCRPAVFCVETLSYEETKDGKKDSLVADLLREKGYLLYADTHTNSIFVDAARWAARNM